MSGPPTQRRFWPLYNTTPSHVWFSLTDRNEQEPNYYFSYFWELVDDRKVSAIILENLRLLRIDGNTRPTGNGNSYLANTVLWDILLKIPLMYQIKNVASVLEKRLQRRVSVFHENNNRVVMVTRKYRRIVSQRNAPLSAHLQANRDNPFPHSCQNWIHEVTTLFILGFLTLRFFFDKWAVNGPIWLRTNLFLWMRPPKCMKLASFRFSIALRICCTHTSKDGHPFRLLQTAISFPRVHKENGRDAINTRTNCRYWNVWHKSFLRFSWPQQSAYGTTEDAVSGGLWYMCRCYRGATSDYSHTYVAARHRADDVSCSWR